MSLRCGQAVLLKIPYPDGAPPDKKRPYLIVEVNSDAVGLLTVSSTEGKGGKLLYRSNYVLMDWFPPFKFPSFVKLDSFQRLPINAVLSQKLLAGGQTLSGVDLQNILAGMQNYRS